MLLLAFGPICHWHGGGNAYREDPSSRLYVAADYRHPRKIKEQVVAGGGFVDLQQGWTMELTTMSKIAGAESGESGFVWES